VRGHPTGGGGSRSAVRGHPTGGGVSRSPVRGHPTGGAIKAWRKRALLCSYLRVSSPPPTGADRPPAALRPRVALILGAGGPVGHAYHAGVLSALSRWGWDPRQADLIIGTSIGSLTGALLRAGMAAEDMMARLVGDEVSAPCQQLITKAGGWPHLVADLTSDPAAWGGFSLVGSPRLLAALALHPRRFRPGVFLAALTRPGRVPQTVIVDIVDCMFDSGWSERSLWLCAVDADTGERVVFGRGGSPQVTVGTAVAASSSVPALFGPLSAHGHRFLDGGLHSPINSDLVLGAEFDLDAVVMSVPMGIAAWPRRSGRDLPGRWVNHWVAERGVKPLAQSGIPVITFEPGPEELEFMHYNAFDLAHRPEIVRRAHRSASRRLADTGATGALGRLVPAQALEP
jgi:NTE family protein